MAALKTYLVCGCPTAEDEQAGHRPGCWLGEAECIAAEAVTANSLRAEPGSATAAAVQALADAGYLAGLTCDQDVWNLLDSLVEARLLTAPGGVR